MYNLFTPFIYNTYIISEQIIKRRGNSLHFFHSNATSTLLLPPSSRYEVLQYFLIMIVLCTPGVEAIGFHPFKSKY